MLRGVEDLNASLEASSSEASAAAIRELRNILITCWCGTYSVAQFAYLIYR